VNSFIILFVTNCGDHFVYFSAAELLNYRSELTINSTQMVHPVSSISHQTERKPARGKGVSMYVIVWWRSGAVTLTLGKWASNRVPRRTYPPSNARTKREPEWDIVRLRKTGAYWFIVLSVLTFWTGLVDRLNGTNNYIMIFLFLSFPPFNVMLMLVTFLVKFINYQFFFYLANQS
jgi:hypothetical protein